MQLRINSFIYLIVNKVLFIIIELTVCPENNQNSCLKCLKDLKNFLQLHYVRKSELQLPYYAIITIV